MPHVQANVTEYAADIHTSGTHLLELINEILDMSKIEAGMYEIREERFDFEGCIHTCIRLVAHDAEARGIRIDVDVPKNLPSLFADPRSVRQILLNLLSNAIKFTDRGGRVAVAAAIAADGLRITVEDTGIGIPADKLEEVLCPFTQADNRLSREYEGTGLGLPITKALVELHGGQLAVDSTVGAGTRITVVLPGSRLTDTADIHENGPRLALAGPA